MKLTVLMDNNTYIDKYLLAEPAASYCIQCEDKKILFDTGYSDAFIKNAEELDIDLSGIDYLVLSHGHSDHVGGVVPLTRILKDRPTLVTHPFTLTRQRIHAVSTDESSSFDDFLSEHFQIETSIEPKWLTERLVFLGEIERANDFEAQQPFGRIFTGEKEQDDYMIEDSAMAYKSEKGLVIVTGCSHSGICNIVEQAKRICDDDRVVDIIGGFHLLSPPVKQLQGTLDYIGSLNLESIHACHCTDLASKIALSNVANLREVGVGLVLTY